MKESSIFKVLLILMILIMFGKLSMNDVWADISFMLNEEEVTLNKGETVNLEATIVPGDIDVSLDWSSSDENVAIVDGKGNVQAINEGTAIIRVLNSYNVEATCVVTVVNATNYSQYILFGGIIVLLIILLKKVLDFF